MSTLEINRIYTSLGCTASEICVSQVKLNFENCRGETKIVSQKIYVPELDAIW